jgi:hypothetical protein
MQKQSARNIVVGPNTQVAYGGILADAALTKRLRFDSSSMFTPTPTRRSDKDYAGKGTEFATDETITAWDTDGNIKIEADSWGLGWMLAMIFGQEVVTGSGAPYTHTFTVPPISAVMPCTTVYVEDTADIKRKFQDMFATDLTITIPERGAVMAELSMQGTGRFTPGAITTMPALPTNSYFLGSDMIFTITTGSAKSYAGRQRNLTIKLSRGSGPFKSSGDGLYAGSGESGKTGFSMEITIIADSTDDIQTLEVNDTAVDISVATDPTKTFQFGFNFPNARVKLAKLADVEDKVAWTINVDETTCLQAGATAAISAFIMNAQVLGYLVAV